MKPVLYTNSYQYKIYSSYGIVSKIKDRFRTKVKKKYFVKDLSLKITDVIVPPNINKSSYCNNLIRAKKISRCNDMILAPRIYRYLDYRLYNNFQKKLMAFSICRSTQMVLKNMNKNIRNSCIVIYDASENIMFYTICFFAEKAKFIVLLSENIKKVNQIREYIIANYGISPVVTSDREIFLKNADFIISSDNSVFNLNSCVWYVCRSPEIDFKNKLSINNVNYKVPWNFENGEMCFELLGAILDQMDEKDIEKSLDYNGTFLNDIKYGDNIISF